MSRGLRSFGIAFGCAIGALALTGVSEAQEVKRTELGRTPVSGVEGKEIVVQLVEIPPGATSRRHFHNGEEVFYVLEGGTAKAIGETAKFLKEQGKVETVLPDYSPYVSAKFVAD